MDDEYTPNTDVVRLLYAIGQGDLSDDMEAVRAEDFDRWLAEEIRKAKADAWYEGYNDGRRQDAEGDDGPRFANPYHEEEQA